MRDISLRSEGIDIGEASNSGKRREAHKTDGAEALPVQPTGSPLCLGGSRPSSRISWPREESNQWQQVP